VLAVLAEAAGQVVRAARAVSRRRLVQPAVGPRRLRRTDGAPAPRGRAQPGRPAESYAFIAGILTGFNGVASQPTRTGNGGQGSDRAEERGGIVPVLTVHIILYNALGVGEG